MIYYDILHERTWTYTHTGVDSYDTIILNYTDNELDTYIQCYINTSKGD